MEIAVLDANAWESGLTDDLGFVVVSFHIIDGRKVSIKMDKRMAFDVGNALIGNSKLGGIESSARMN